MGLSNTQKIGFWPIFMFLLLSPIVAVTYSLYSLCYWMLGVGVPRWLVWFPVGIVFALVNIFHNWVVCTIIFREFPREFFTTDRLRRLKKQQDDTPKRELADMIGGFLNSQDMGHY